MSGQNALPLVWLEIGHPQKAKNDVTLIGPYAYTDRLLLCIDFLVMWDGHGFTKRKVLQYVDAVFRMDSEGNKNMTIPAGNDILCTIAHKPGGSGEGAIIHAVENIKGNGPMMLYSMCRRYIPELNIKPRKNLEDTIKDYVKEKELLIPFDEGIWSFKTRGEAEQCATNFLDKVAKVKKGVKWDLKGRIVPGILVGGVISEGKSRLLEIVTVMETEVTKDERMNTHDLY